MKHIANEYKNLLLDFLDKKISSDSFQEKYIDKFKSEEREIPENLYEILEDIFAICDSFTKDDHLIKEYGNYYLNEDEFMEKLKNIYNTLDY